VNKSGDRGRDTENGNDGAYAPPLGAARGVTSARCSGRDPRKGRVRFVGDSGDEAYAPLAQFFYFIDPCTYRGLF